ncbi:hypothetical protein Ciccas_002120 [Cichlidogyrus casuarinus]|uniref:Uncharacterized protein n=1 Tax=Cichlidogyrus casuarinus TaxID=1844966 RepID=A0ABD2QI49_9PLAT
MSKLLIPLAILSLLQLTFGLVPVKSTERDLLKRLLNRYQSLGKNGRPVVYANETFKLNYGLSLIQILDLNAGQRTLRTSCWPRYNWTDKLLSWDPKEYGNIDKITLPSEDVWVPEISLQNSADERLHSSRDARLLVSHNGSVLWMPQTIFKSTCRPDLTYFPFDTQICELDFGSWNYDLTKVDIDWRIDDSTSERILAFDMSDYVPSNEWKTKGRHLGVRYERSVPVYDYKLQKKVTKNYRVLRYRIILARNPGFYSTILVIPCAMLSVMTIVLFWLPPESPAKNMLGMNIFVAFFVLLLLLAESTPSGVTTFPLIGLFYIINMIFIVMTSFLAAFVVNMHRKTDKSGTIPRIVRRIVIDGLGHLLQGPFCANEACLLSNHGPIRYKDPVSILKRSTSPIREESKYLEIMGKPESIVEFTKGLQSIRASVMSYANRLSHKITDGESVTAEWRKIALVMDRFFFLLYVACMGITLALIVPSKGYESRQLDATIALD